MSFKPVDFQVMMPKTMEISKMYNDELHKNHVLYQQQASTIQDKAESSTRQVMSREKVQEAKINRKHEKNQHSKKQHSKKDDKDNNGKTATNAIGNIIDISL